MARPQKLRKICSMPGRRRFGPLGGPAASEDPVIMTVDEYEAVRLIDLEGFSQEECAEKMNVARTTVQSIYTSARKKVAELVANGKPLLIEGGSFRLCDGTDASCRNRGCCKRRHGR